MQVKGMRRETTKSRKAKSFRFDAEVRVVDSKRKQRQQVRDDKRRELLERE